MHTFIWELDRDNHTFTYFIQPQRGFLQQQIIELLEVIPGSSVMGVVVGVIEWRGLVPVLTLEDWLNLYATDLMSAGFIGQLKRFADLPLFEYILERITLAPKKPKRTLLTQ